MLGTLADVVMLGGLLFLGERMMARWRGLRSFRGFALLLLALAVLRSLAETLRYLGLPTLEWHPPHASHLLVAGLAVLALIATYALGRWRSLTRFIANFFLGLSLMLLFNVGNLTYAAMTEPKRPYSDLQPAPTNKDTPGPRVVWILFDTLDYHYTFDERPGWLKLPEFDRWLNTTVRCEDARSPGPRTEISIPSLLTGRLYVDQQATKPNDFDMTRLDGGHESLRAQRTVFADAEAIGARTALLGFHIPYGRIMGEQLSYCRWWQWPNQFGSEESWPEDTMRQFVFLGSSNQQFESMAERRIANHIAEVDSGLKLACDPSYRLVFIHLFPPHPGGIYNAKTHRFNLDMGADPEEYQHSLGLADATLREIREAMERAGTWSNTLVLVSADHSWRSAVDYGKPVYLRIPFFAHFPGQSTAVSIPETTNTLWTHDLVLAYLRGQVASPAAMAAWVANWTHAHPEVPMVDDPRHAENNIRDRER